MLVRMISASIYRICKFSAFFFAAGFLLALLIFWNSGMVRGENSEVRLGGGRFTNPLLECEF